MNVNSTNSSISSGTVVSKYFSSSPVMDESLSEFKEKKEGFKGPKNSQKSTVSKPKPKKLPKRGRGQKDIRTALKSKKNEQLTYAKEFDDVCKHAGVDVDSEQLQLAIALSKSLQSEDNNVSTSQKPLSSQERIKKIRTTLQEYGFQIPEIKVTNKRAKNHRKKYKLLLSTDAEKRQIVSDRYAQVLFRNSSSYKCVVSEDVDYSLKKCYYMATGIPYSHLQNNRILYVEDLVEKSTSKGSLLRDWGDIPGRPQSPVRSESLKMNFSEIECSQDELDIVLSGTLKSAKDVVRKKVESMSSNTTTVVIDLDDNSKPDMPAIIEDVNDNTLVNEENAERVDVSKDKTLCVSDRVRSCSPDIFDDDVSVVLDDKNTSNAKLETSKIKDDVILDLTEDDNEQSSYNNNKPNENKNPFVMDLTQVNNHEINYRKDVLKQDVTEKSFKPIFQCSGGSDFTKRKSDDFMEITDCVGVSSPKTNSKIVERDIPRRHSDDFMAVIESVAISCSQLNSNKNHLQTTMSQTINKTKRKSNDPMEITECVASTSHCNSLNVEDNIDLTQNSDEVTTNIVGEIVNDIIENVDLSQSSNSGDDLPFIQVSGTNKSLDDTIMLNNDEIFDEIVSKSSAGKTKPCTITSEHTLDLTDTPPSPVKTDNSHISSNRSFFDEFVHNHSDETNKETESNHTENEEIVKESHNNDEVDLTQSSNSSLVSTGNDLHNSIQGSKSSFSSKNDVSVDYDEMYDNIIENNHTYVGTKNIDTASSVIYDITDENELKTSESDNVSVNSQVFDISDKELEYSLNQSRNDGRWDDNGGISVIDRDSSIRKSDINNEKTKEHTINGTMNESLPMVKIKSNINIQRAEDEFKTPVFKEKAVTPFKAFNNRNQVSIDTPTNNEYIVKTDQVTPMMDYASMSTPERNRELDKYGLKPFKRKRAIQLLTHLYNQTHPIVESCQDDLPSPSKKRKQSQPSPKKVKSPRELLKSPVKMSQLTENVYENCETNVYEVTKEVPDIKEVDCSEEDWVFQKREKAKVHSCRVPLHVALHNYVSCRRKLREAILRYEPVNIDVIHKELVASGHRYDPKDLLKYLDKKCITVKTADNNARNNKR